MGDESNIAKTFSAPAAALFLILYADLTDKNISNRTKWSISRECKPEYCPNKNTITVTIEIDHNQIQVFAEVRDGDVTYTSASPTFDKQAVDNRFQKLDAAAPDDSYDNPSYYATEALADLFHWTRQTHVAIGGRGKRLGAGAYGGVFADKGGIVKIEHILKSHVHQSLAAPYWREIEFAKAMAPHAPTFMTLVDARIDSSCRYKHAISTYASSGFRRRLKALMASPFCSIKRWTPRVDTTLGSLVYYTVGPAQKAKANAPSGPATKECAPSGPATKASGPARPEKQQRLNGKWQRLNDREFRNVFIQVIHAVTLMEAQGYRHTDLHFNNVGLLATREKTVAIRGRDVPTHGHRVCIIDYGCVLHAKYPMTKRESYLIDISDLLVSMSFAIDNTAFWEKHPWVTNDDAFKKAYKVDERLFDRLSSKPSSPHREQVAMLLYEMYRFEDYQRLMLGDRFTKAVPPHLHLPEEDILFVLSHLDDSGAVLDHFLQKLDA